MSSTEEQQLTNRMIEILKINPEKRTPQQKGDLIRVGDRLWLLTQQRLGITPKSEVAQ